MSTPALKGTVATHAICIALAFQDGRAPEWVQLMPYGTFKGRDGRGPYSLADKAAAEVVIATSNARAGSLEPVFDYCHQTDLGAVAGVGGVAPASGWIKELQARDDGIYGRVEWTAAASAAIEAKEYRYASPVFAHTKSGQVLAILRASLTNTPNLDLPALASEQTTGDDMDYSKIAQALGLGAEATEEQILAAIANFNKQTTAASELTKVRQHLKLGDDADGTAVITAIAAQAKSGSAEPNEAVIALQSEVNDLKAKEIGREVDGHIKAGRIAPASRDDFIALASSDRARFDSIVGKAPIIIAPGTTPVDTGKVVDGKYVLSPDQTALCSQMGWDPEVYAKTKLEEENA